MARQRVVLSFLLMLACAAVTAGCHKGPATAQVSGKVAYKDGTVPHGAACVVQFSPVADSTGRKGSAASGAIQADGSFQMSTRQAGDGVLLGDYAVTFIVWRNPTDPTTSMVAPKYGVPGMTPYKITVEKDVSDLKYEVEPMPGGATGAPPADAAK